VRPLLKELRFALLVALAAVCALSLCGCRDSKAAIEVKRPWIVVPGFAVCFGALAVRVMRRIHDAAKRRERPEQLAPGWHPPAVREQGQLHLGQVR